MQPDPFEPPAPLPKDRRIRLDALLDRLVHRGVEPDVSQALGEYVAEAPAQEIARIRPLALARRLGYEEYPRQAFMDDYLRITRRCRRAMERVFVEAAG